jgi:hypothetical protein
MLSPTLPAMDLTIPPVEAFRTYSIFMAMMTAIDWPGLTSSPICTKILSMIPGIGADKLDLLESPSLVDDKNFD